jgi:hypothetical protein
MGFDLDLPDDHRLAESIKAFHVYLPSCAQATKTWSRFETDSPPNIFSACEIPLIDFISRLLTPCDIAWLIKLLSMKKDVPGSTESSSGA